MRWGRCPQTPEVFRMEAKVEEHEKPQPVQAGAVGVLTLNLWVQRPLGLRFRRALSVVNRCHDWSHKSPPQLEIRLLIKNSPFDPAIRPFLIRREQRLRFGR